MSFGLTVECNGRLVRTVEKHPCIYNYHIQEYSSRQHKQEAWTLIATELGANVAQCKEKWRNLRICYTEYIRKYASDTPNQLNNRSYLTGAMKFLRPFIRTREDNNRSLSFSADTSDVSNFSDLISPKLENFDDTEIIHDDELMNEKYLENIQKEELDISSITETRNVDDSKIELPDLVPAKRSHMEIANTDKTVLLTSSPRYQFLMSIWPDLEKMSDRQMRKFRSRVSTTIEEILDNE